MSTDNPAGDEGTPQTPFQLSYPDASHVTATEAAADVVLTADANRPAVRLDARVKDPLKLREALSALYTVVASDYRYKPKDKAAYAAYLRMKRETSHLAVWQAQQA